MYRKGELFCVKSRNDIEYRFASEADATAYEEAETEALIAGGRLVEAQSIEHKWATERARAKEKRIMGSRLVLSLPEDTHCLSCPCHVTSQFENKILCRATGVWDSMDDHGFVRGYQGKRPAHCPLKNEV